MKRTIISTLLLCILAGLLYVVWQKFGWQDTTPPPVAPQNSGSVAELLGQQQTTGETTTGTDITISSWELQWFDYAWGGEYKPFFPQTAKQALGDKKDVILYFYDPKDPTDQALDKDIQARIDRIPANSIILRIDYTANKSLVDSFNVTQQNTLIFLDETGTERTRRAVWITTLMQIVKALKE